MPASSILPRPLGRPGPRFLLGHPANFIALGFGVGLIPFAPGTFGTVLALPLFGLLHPRLESGDFLLLLGGMYVAGIWICDKAGRNLGVEDHKAIVWDEIVAFLLVLFFTPPTLLWQALAFLLFRLFDIFKPGPIHAIEKMFRSGFGVMLDDLLAAFFALLCLTLTKLLAPVAGGLLGPGTI